MHSFLLQQQRLRRITSAALVLESTPEALRFDVQQQLKPLLACLSELGLSQVPHGVARAQFWGLWLTHPVRHASC